MDKVYVVQILFLIVQVFAVIALTAAVFGDMNLGVISVSAMVLWVGLLGNAVCAVIRAVQGAKKK